MRRKKFALGLALVAGAVLGQLAITAPANAYVSNCTTGFSSVGAFAQCGYSSSGYYKVRVLCQNRFTLNSHFVYGPAKSVSSQVPSTATCEWYERYYGDAHAQEA